MLLALLAACRFNFDLFGGDDDDDASIDAPPSVRAVAYIKASNPDSFDNFGLSVALSGDGLTLAVSAPAEDSSSAATEADNSVAQSGAVYIFVRSGATWTQQAYIKAAFPDADDFFGWSVALSGDGNTLAVGAPAEDGGTRGINGLETDNSAGDSGAAYVFVRSGTTWSQQAYIKSANSDAADSFGETVALSGDGNTLAVGAIGEDSTATNIDGTATNNMGTDSGAAYVFARTGTTWMQQAYVKASNTGQNDEFGWSIALSTDGNTLVVAAPSEDSASEALPDDNSVLESGAAYVYTRAPTWAFEAYVKAPVPGSGDFFGRHIALSAGGDQLICSAPGEDTVIANSGAAYKHVRSGTTWLPATTFKAPQPGGDDQFGSSVATGDGTTIVITASTEDSAATGFDGDATNNDALDSGAAYVFRDGASTFVKPTVTGAGDIFGYAAAMSSNGLAYAIGSYHEDSASPGIDGDATDDSYPDAGAVFVVFYY